MVDVVGGEICGGGCRAGLMFLGFNSGRVAEGPMVEQEGNPDDAAVDNSGIGILTPWPYTCLAQFENLGEETPSNLFSRAVSS